MPAVADPPIDLRRPALALVLAGAAAAIAAIWRQPTYVTDRDIYQQIGRSLIVPDCSSLHCTRVLVASVLESLPMPSLLSWKLYAVVANTIAALGTARLGRRFGLSERASWFAAALVALGRGSQLTLFDPYTADPFIYALVPWMMLALLGGRFWLAGIAGAIGVFGKEFAAAPLWIVTFYALLARRRDVAARAGLAALCVSTLWLSFQLVVALRYNYSYGGNPSSQLQSGGYLVTWIQSLGWAHAFASLVLHFGPLLFLASVGWGRSPRLLRQLAIASIPVVVVLTYVQQPDRAWWNFEWALAPLASFAVERKPGWRAVLFIASYAVVNLPAFSETAVRTLALPFAMCAGAAVLLVWPHRASSNAAAEAGEIPVAQASGSDRRLVLAAVPVLVAAVALLLLALDVSVHRSVESAAGVNIWGYRGPVAKQKRRGEVRVAILDGRQIFGRRVEGSIPGLLELYLNIPWMQQNLDYTATGLFTVVNLASPYDGVSSFRGTLADYQSLKYDVVCLYVGHDDPAPTEQAAAWGWRRQSIVFRATGYLPMVPTVWRLNRTLDDTAGRRNLDRALDWNAYTGALGGAIDDAMARGARVLVATNPSVGGADAERQDRMAAWLAGRYGSSPKLRYQDLRRVVDVGAPNLDGYIAESLTQNVFRLLNQQ